MSDPRNPHDPPEGAVHYGTVHITAEAYREMCRQKADPDLEAAVERLLHSILGDAPRQGSRPERVETPQKPLFGAEEA